MSYSGIGNVSPVMKGKGKIHILEDYSRPEFELSYPSNSRCNIDVIDFERLEEMSINSFMDHPNACKKCVDHLRND